MLLKVLEVEGDTILTTDNRVFIITPNPHYFLEWQVLGVNLLTGVHHAEAVLIGRDENIYAVPKINIELLIQKPMNLQRDLCWEYEGEDIPLDTEIGNMCRSLSRMLERKILQAITPNSLKYFE